MSPNTLPSPILDAVRSVASWGFSIIAIVILPLAFFAPKGMAVLLALAGALSALAYWAGRAQAPRASEPATQSDYMGLGFVALFMFAAISCFWSPHPVESVATLIGLGGSLACGWILIRFISGFDAAERRRLSTAIIIGGAIGYSLLASDIVTGNLIWRTLFESLGRQVVSPDTIPNLLKAGLTVAALFIWPWSYALSRRWGRGWAIVLTSLITIVIAQYQSHSAVIALTIGALAAAVAAPWPKAAGRLLAVLILCGMGLMPFLVRMLPDPTQHDSHLGFLPNSAVHRVHIWRNTAILIPDAPILGRGMDASRMMYDWQSSESLIFLPDRPDGGFTSLSEPIPLHPHSFILQVWLELGAVGVLLVSGFLILVVNKIASLRGGGERFVAFGALVSGAVIASVSFGVWQSWWLASLFLSASFTALLVRERVSVDVK